MFVHLHTNIIKNCLIESSLNSWLKIGMPNDYSSNVEWRYIYTCSLPVMRIRQIKIPSLCDVSWVVTLDIHKSMKQSVFNWHESASKLHEKKF